MVKLKNIQMEDEKGESEWSRLCEGKRKRD